MNFKEKVISCWHRTCKLIVPQPLSIAAQWLAHIQADVVDLARLS